MGATQLINKKGSGGAMKTD